MINFINIKMCGFSWDDLPEVDFYTIKLTPPIGPNPSESIRSNLARIWLQDMNPDTKYSIELCGWSEKEGDDFHTDSVQYTQFTAPPGLFIKTLYLFDPLLILFNSERHILFSISPHLDFKLT